MKKILPIAATLWISIECALKKILAQRLRFNRSAKMYSDTGEKQSLQSRSVIAIYLRIVKIRAFARGNLNKMYNLIHLHVLGDFCQ